MDYISEFYTLQQKISTNLRDYKKNDSIKNESFINDLINYINYGKYKDLISFVSMTINMYKKEINDIYTEINEENKIKLIKNIKTLFPLKNEKEDIYRSLIEFNFKNLCDKQDKIVINPIIEIKLEKNNIDDKILIDEILDNDKKKIDNDINPKNEKKKEKNEDQIPNVKEIKEIRKKTKIEQKINNIIKEINKINSKRKIKDYIIENVRNNKINEIYNGFPISDNIKNISEELKLKIITLICIFFPFFTKNCKIKIIKNLKQYFPNITHLDTNLLLYNYSESNYTYITNYIKNNKSEQNNEDFFQFKTSFDIIERYKLIILSKDFKLNNKDFILKLSFVIYLKLINYQILNYDILFFLPILFFIKEFYTNVYNSDLKDEKDFLKYDNNKKKIYFKDIYPDEYNKNLIINNLFTEEEINYFKQTLSSIRKFYNIDNYKGAILADLKIPYLNKLFSIHILDLELIKEKYIKSNFKKYKQNLIKLETEIYDEIIKKNFKPENKIVKTLYIDQDIKKKFEQFNQEMKNEFQIPYSFKLYPYGSITEFLSSKSSDLDMYLEIPKLVDNIKNSSHFLDKLDNFLSRNFKPNYRLIMSKRICVYSFKYNNFDFDLSVTGFSPYLHSSIFRAFSLMDSRFPILVCLMKKIIKILDLKYMNNKDANNYYLNSFCWVLLIVSYLQDIITPPILPKIFENSSSINKNILYPNYLNKKRNNKYIDSYDFQNFISSMKKECVKIPNGTLEDYLEIYKKKITIINKLSISELLLGFLEFIIYFYKFDVMYNNFSFSGEGFMNMSHIKEDKNSVFYQYFQNKYLKFNSHQNNNNQNERDGIFLFRDPFDSHYNPGQTLKSNHFNQMFEKLEFTYITLLETGSIKELINRLEKKKEKEL